MDLKDTFVMRLKVFVTALVLICTCFLNCDGKKNMTSLKVLTYNVWFIEAAENALSTKEDRKEKIIEALKKSNSDIVCMQEVFLGQDVEDIVNSVQENFPYSFSGIHDDVNDFPPQAQGSRKPPCGYFRLIYFIVCALINGCTSSNSAGELAACLRSKCLSQTLDIFQNDNQECIDCLSTSGLNLAQCTAIWSVKGGRQMNDGGLVLLSKKKLLDASFNEFYPNTKEIYAKGYIKAEVEDIATVVCTHMSTESGGIEFFEPDLEKEGFTSYEDMNAYEAEVLIRSLRDIQKVILLGDFNTGLAFDNPKITPKVPESYLKLEKNFSTKPALKFTSRDPLDHKRQTVVDHVFVKNLIIRKTKRLFVPKKGEDPMSDHVGVQSVLKLA